MTGKSWMEMTLIGRRTLTVCSGCFIQINLIFLLCTFGNFTKNFMSEKRQRNNILETFFNVILSTNGERIMNKKPSVLLYTVGPKCLEGWGWIS